MRKIIGALTGGLAITASVLTMTLTAVPAQAAEYTTQDVVEEWGMTHTDLIDMCINEKMTPIWVAANGKPVSVPASVKKTCKADVTADAYVPEGFTRVVSTIPVVTRSFDEIVSDIRQNLPTTADEKEYAKQMDHDNIAAKAFVARDKMVWDAHWGEVWDAHYFEYAPAEVATIVQEWRAGTRAYDHADWETVGAFEREYFSRIFQLDFETLFAEWLN